MSKSLDEIVKSCEHVAIFGAGSFGIVAYEYLISCEINVVNFYDNDKSKYGTFCCGCEILNPNLILEKKPLIVIASTWENQIVEQLKNMNYKNYTFIDILGFEEEYKTWKESRFASDSNLEFFQKNTKDLLKWNLPSLIKNSNEILGQKVSKFDGNVENYDNLEEYIDIVENADIKVDPKEKLSPEEYHAYRVLGIAIRIANLSEKMKYEIEPEFISGVARLGLADNLKIIKEIFELAKLENKHLDLEGYLDNKLDVDDDVEVYEFLEEVLEKSGEEKTVTELLKGAE